MQVSRWRLLKASIPGIQTARSGFTLFELLLAAILTAAIAAASISALAEILRINQENEFESLRRQDLNRGLEFIADEIRGAAAIAPDAADDLKNAPQFSLPGGASVVLSLRVPGISERVIYYLAANERCSQDSNAWLPPRVICRWGPHFNADGNYSNPTTPNLWQRMALIDVIDDGTITPQCPTQWLPNPANSARGFYACIDPTGRIAEVHLRGQVDRPRATNNPSYQIKTYEVQGNVSVRNR
jgi:hypothetical protein